MMETGCIVGIVGAAIVSSAAAVIWMNDLMRKTWNNQQARHREHIEHASKVYNEQIIRMKAMHAAELEEVRVNEFRKWNRSFN